jgi:Gamma-glutamyltranspeptidase
MPNPRPMFRTIAILVAASVVPLAGIDAIGSPNPGVKEFSAVSGDRTSGWLAQTRSELLARNGVVATSQPLAAQDHIDPKKASTPESRGDPVGGTVYLAVADRWGNMVSFIYSIYDSFGAGITVPGYGFVLNDRGALFSLDPKSPNLIAPGKRPFHLNRIFTTWSARACRPWDTR